jgi:glycosyltransferase involved in cell wall biosynthesis
MCADLADGLVVRGHRVITIGAGPQGTKAEHIATYDDPPSSRIGERWPEVVHAAQVARMLAQLDVDIIHDHSLAGPLSAASRTAPTVVTAHFTTVGEPGLYYDAIAGDVELVAISDAQRRNAPHLPWATTVHNALHIDEAPFQPVKGDHLVFLGRMNEEKGVAEAIDVARRAGRRLVIAGKCQEPIEKEYFNQVIRPRLGSDVEWIGEVYAADKWSFLGEAAGLLFPIAWEEPFGMVMIEAMATGTPVLGFNRGAVPEVIVDGVTGFICRDLDHMVDAVDHLADLDPAVCRQHVRDHFDVSVMVEGYERIYREALAKHRPHASTPLGE